ncbi:MAG: hypothetical protein ACOY31_02615 [Bacillota bacterium]
MSVTGKVGDSPVKGAYHFWGRVRDQRGNSVEGALVVLSLMAGEREICLGHTYSGRQGFYHLTMNPGDFQPGNGLVRISAAMGTPPAAGTDMHGKTGFHPAPHSTGPLVECQVENYHRFKAVISGDGGRKICIEAVPETVKAYFFTERLSGVRIISVRGRGYLKSGGERDGGQFSLTFCTIGEGPAEQNLMRIRTVPADRNRKMLFYDSGAVLAHIL